MTLWVCQKACDVTGSAQVVASHLAPGVTKTDTLYRHFNILTKGELSNLDNIVLFWNQWRLFDSFS